MEDSVRPLVNGVVSDGIPSPGELLFGDHGDQTDKVPLLVIPEIVGALEFDRRRRREDELPKEGFFQNAERERVLTARFRRR